MAFVGNKLYNSVKNKINELMDCTLKSRDLLKKEDDSIQFKDIKLTPDPNEPVVTSTSTTTITTETLRNSNGMLSTQTNTSTKNVVINQDSEL